MTKEEFLDSVRKQDEMLERGGHISTPTYNPTLYYRDVAAHPYFRYLTFLRHHIKRVSDFYMGEVVSALNIDLFMLTPSISSPMGPGSDSEAVAIKFGNLDTFLVDSSQFGFEPLLVNGLDRVYCYLPSMRGEDPDDRHLNQFYHCEIEIAGAIDDIIPLAEGYVRALADTLLAMPNTLARLSQNFDISKDALRQLFEPFPVLSFDEAYETLRTETGDEFVKRSSSGRIITAKGERLLMKKIGVKTPVWISNYDRDTVPFYQKPHTEDSTKVLNADLIFPPVGESGFSGEVLGLGQRQDTVSEMRESLSRQHVSAEPYEWYIALREFPGYRTSSGFGLGIERFIAWALGKQAIRDVILYPRLKNVPTIP